MMIEDLNKIQEKVPLEVLRHQKSIHRTTRNIKGIKEVKSQDRIEKSPKS